MAPILNRSPLAAICFKDDNGNHIRVYYQDTEGHIRETYYDDHRGWARRSEDVVGKGKLNTGIAAIYWKDGTQIRVYFLSPDNQLVERCYTGGAAGAWSDGALTTRNKFIAAPYSQLAAVGYGSGLNNIRVFYQDASNKLCQAIYTDSWAKGGLDLPVAVPGTSISATATTARPGQQVWVYYQQADMHLAEWLMSPEGKWTRGGLDAKGTYAPGACIAALVEGNINIQVFAVNDNNDMTVTAFRKETWQKTVELPTVITFSSVAAVTVATTSEWIRIYCQPSGGLISERGSNDGGQSFVTMQQSLPIDN